MKKIYLVPMANIAVSALQNFLLFDHLRFSAAQPIHINPNQKLVYKYNEETNKKP